MITKVCPTCQTVYRADTAHICPRASQTGAVVGQGAQQGEIIDGRYQVETILGEGGMGIVLKARHILLGKVVAVKLLREAQDEASRKRFVQEARSASSLNHPNIVGITDFGFLPDNRAYLVMEYLQGKTLTQVIAQAGVVPPLRACQIAIQIARGLQAVHDGGIIHRDLKPDNIFVIPQEGGGEQIKIVDFGIAKTRAPTGGARLTQAGMVVGTGEYMSPEQASGKEVDNRSDQYSLGCILYEMLTGVIPFEGKNVGQIMTKHVYEKVVPPRQRRPDLPLPETLEAVVLRTLEKNREARYPTMAQLEQALQQEVDLIQNLSSPDAVRALEALQGQSRIPTVGKVMMVVGLLALVAILVVAYIRSSQVHSVALPERATIVVTPVKKDEQGPAKAPVPPSVKKAAPDPAPVKEAPKEGQVTVTFVVQKPTTVGIACQQEEERRCERRCEVQVPRDGQCSVSAPGYKGAVMKIPYILKGTKEGKAPTWKIRLKAGSR